MGVDGSELEEGLGGGTNTRSTVDWRTRFAGRRFVREEMIRGGEKYQIGPSCVGRRLVSYRRGGQP